MDGLAVSDVILTKLNPCTSAVSVSLSAAILYRMLSLLNSIPVVERKFDT